MPAKSSSVAAKSTFSTIASVRLPGWMDFGYRTRNGMRIDSSYIQRLSW